MITKQPIAKPLLGHPSLKVLRLNTDDILATAADRLRADIDIRAAPPTLEKAE